MGDILVNDRCLYRGGTGVSRYLQNVLAHWPADCPLRPQGFCRQLPSFYRNLIARPSSAPAMRLRPLSELGCPTRLAKRIPHWLRRMLQRGYSRRFARTYRRGGYSASFEPNHLAVPVDGPTVTTMHDVSVLEHPEWHPADRVAQWQADLEATIRQTVRWIAVSEFTRARMVRLLGVPGERIEVIPLAARRLPELAPGDPPAAALPGRFFLHLGTLEPRKNVSLLLDAWQRLPGGVRGGCRLVLAGPAGWGSPGYFQGLIGHPAAGEVLWAGYVSDSDAAWLLSHAAAMLAPSLYEGFGLPILEAMAAGAPVICSANEAFQEVGGQAAEVIQSPDPTAWALAMRRALEDSAWRQDRIRAGLERAAAFAWDKTARRHAAVFQSVAGI